jgi:hypothetical protein
MTKHAFRLIMLTIVLILAFGSYKPGRATSQTAITPSATINIAHFKPPNMDAATAVGNFNTMILTNGDHTYRNQIIANGFASAIPEYFRADGIQNPGSCTATPANNQVAYNPGDFCFISQNYPDWFLLDNYGRRITVTSSGEYYRMDPANPGWRQFFVARVLESQNQYGWNALFLDNVEGSLSKFYGPKPVKYPDNASYQAAIMGFLQNLDVNYSQAYGRPIIGNIVARDSDAVWFNYLQYLDGAMQERFAVDWDETDYLRVDKWLNDLVMMEQTQANGKDVILIAPGNQGDLNRQKFAFASYLLISNGRAAFRYSTDDAYREVWLYDNYNLNLGLPIGRRYQQGTAWRRDYSLGYVVVDPVYHTASINTTSVPSIFFDVPSYHWAWSYIERLYSARITSGCGTTPLIYCPEGQVNRAQMAVFLLRGIHGSSYIPSAVGGSTGFVDVPNNYWAAAWIKQLAAEGVTSGCGGGNFCPNSPVTRAEMAVFLLRSKYGSSYIPPNVESGTGFLDVPVSYWASAWIKQLAVQGIAGGCGNGNYCPENPVTRAEMAVLLVRTFSLP